MTFPMTVYNSYSQRRYFSYLNYTHICHVISFFFWIYVRRYSPQKFIKRSLPCAWSIFFIIFIFIFFIVISFSLSHSASSAIIPIKQLEMSLTLWPLWIEAYSLFLIRVCLSDIMHLFIFFFTFIFFYCEEL